MILRFSHRDRLLVSGSKYLALLTVFALGGPPVCEADVAKDIGETIEKAAMVEMMLPEMCVQPSTGDQFLDTALGEMRPFIRDLSDQRLSVRSQALSRLNVMLSNIFGFINYSYVPGTAPTLVAKYQAVLDWLAGCQGNAGLEVVRRIGLLVDSVTAERDHARNRIQQALLYAITNSINASRQTTFLRDLTLKLQGGFQARINADPEGVEAAFDFQAGRAAEHVIAQEVARDTGDYLCSIPDRENAEAVSVSTDEALAHLTMSCTPDYPLLLGNPDPLTAFAVRPFEFWPILRLEAPERGVTPVGGISLVVPLETAYPRQLAVDVNTLPAVSPGALLDWMWINDLISDELFAALNRFQVPLPTLSFSLRSVETTRDRGDAVNPASASFNPLDDGETVVCLSRRVLLMFNQPTLCTVDDREGTVPEDQTLRGAVKAELAAWRDRNLMHGNLP